MHEFNEEAKMVAACKEKTDEAGCESLGDCSYLKFDSSTCGGNGNVDGNYETLTDLTATATADPGATPREKCYNACAALGDDCFEFVLSVDAGTGALTACTGYSGHCTLNAATAQDKVYRKVPCCYWTTPTLVIADSLCANKAEATMNGANSATYEFTSATHNLGVAYNKMSCQ
jgi:hypothetical protein